MDSKLIITIFLLPLLSNGQQDCDDFGTAEREENPGCANATVKVYTAVQTLEVVLVASEVAKYCSTRGLP